MYIITVLILHPVLCILMIEVNINSLIQCLVSINSSSDDLIECILYLDTYATYKWSKNL